MLPIEEDVSSNSPIYIPNTMESELEKESSVKRLSIRLHKMLQGELSHSSHNMNLCINDTSSSEYINISLSTIFTLLCWDIRLTLTSSFR